MLQDQASWICQCGDDIIQPAQEDFKRMLTERASLEQFVSLLHIYTPHTLSIIFTYEPFVCVGTLAPRNCEQNHWQVQRSSRARCCVTAAAVEVVILLHSYH